MKKGNSIKKFYSYSGFEIKEVYSKEDLPITKKLNLEENSKIESWDFNQSTSAGSPEKMNGELFFLVEHGHTSLSIEVDKPTLLGIDSDDLDSNYQVGKKGVPIDTIDDMEILFKDIPIENLSISFETDFTAPILYTMFLAIAEKRKIPMEKLKGSIRNDILGGLMSEGELVLPLENSLKLLVDTVEFTTKNTPNFHAVKIHGTRELYPDITASQEIAFSLSKAFSYINNCIDRGLKIDDFSDKIGFNFDTRSDFFEEIAKYRSARRIWNETITNNFCAQEKTRKSIHFNAKCDAIDSVSTQPEDNLVRISYQVMASALGGANTITCSPYDQNFCDFNKESLLLALRTQQILMEETNLLCSEDLFSGSFFIENLTSRITNEITEILTMIDSRGGIIPCIKKGILQIWIKSGEKSISGINKKIEESEEEHAFTTTSNQTEIENNQIQKLIKIKKTRDSLKVAEALKKIENSAKTNKNIIPQIMHAIKLHATIGEIVTTLKNYMEKQTKQG